MLHVHASYRTFIAIVLLTNRLNAAASVAVVVAGAYSMRIKTWLTGRIKGNPFNNNDEQ
jgi:hypothetical protein